MSGPFLPLTGRENGTLVLKSCGSFGSEESVSYPSPLSKRSALLLGAVLLIALIGSAGLFYRFSSWGSRQGVSISQARTHRRNGIELTGIIGTQYHAGTMAFSPDAKVLALPKGDGRVELWNLETGKAHVLVSAFNKEGFPADRVAFSDGGRLLAVLYREPGVVIWDLSQNKERTFIAVRLPQYVDDFAFGDADRTLVTIMGRFMTFSAREFRRGHSAVVWDSLNGEKKADHVFDPIHVFKAISPDGRYAVMQSSEGQTGFDLVTGKRAFAVNGEGEFAFSRDGLALACYNGEEAWLWDVPSGQRLRYFAFRPSYCAGAYCWQRGGVAISPDKTLLAAANFLQTNVVGVISLETGTAVAELECGPSIMLSDVVLFSPDGRLVATDTQKVDGNDRQVQPPLKLWRVLDSWRGTSQRGAQVGSASESSEKARNIRPPIPRVGKAPP